jgi:hypothetical protein
LPLTDLTFLQQLSPDEKTEILIQQVKTEFLEHCRTPYSHIPKIPEILTFLSQVEETPDNLTDTQRHARSVQIEVKN